ncbi:MAG: hypothetical protein HYZ57_19955 [Acidobacteria bacterium]|nr:hypothetical protein [Acidobacteriota bacterium]MBI3282101.1 hypothetical protein [Acidobacteriota bacterium]
MASSTAKKVRVQRFDRETLAGFVNPATFLTPEGVELLSLSGTASVVPYSDIKIVHFVREFQAAEPVLERRTFLARPKMEGLWVRMRFRDDEVLESVVPNNLLQLDAAGFMVAPPDFAGSSPRLFVPRAALREVQVLGVVGSPLRPARRKPKPPPKEQIGLFE